MKNNEDLLQHEYEKGEQAKQAMEYFIQPFFDSKREQLFDEIQRVKLGDADTLTAIHHQMKSLAALCTDIQTYIDTGKMAAIELNKLRKNTEKG